MMSGAVAHVWAPQRAAGWVALPLLVGHLEAGYRSPVPVPLLLRRQGGIRTGRGVYLYDLYNDLPYRSR